MRERSARSFNRFQIWNFKFEILSQRKGFELCVKLLRYSAAIAKSGITRLPRTRRPPRGGWSSRSSASVAASTQGIRKLNSNQHLAVSIQPVQCCYRPGETRSERRIARAKREGAAARRCGALERNRGVSSTAKLPVSKTGLGGSNPSAPARFWKAGRTGWDKEGTDGEGSNDGARRSGQ